MSLEKYSYCVDNYIHHPLKTASQSLEVYELGACQEKRH